MNMVSIEELEALTMGKRDGNRSLPNMLKIAGIPKGKKIKEDMVKAMYDFYKNEDNLLQYWNRLEGLEKELLQQYVLHSRYLEWEQLQQIFTNYGQALDRPYSYSWEGTVACFPENSAARLFFVGSSIPDSLFNWLRQRIPPDPVSYHPVAAETVIANSEFTLAFGETSHHQFVRMIRTAGQFKLKATASALPTKAAAVKFLESLQQIEPFPSGYGSISNIRTFEQTTIIYGMYMILDAAGVLISRNGEIIVGPMAKHFLQLESTDQITFLRDAYLQSIRIMEWNRIPEIKAKVQYSAYLLSARQVLLDHLAECPPLEWIPTSELLHYVKKNNRQFMSKCVGEIFTYDDYDRDYHRGQYDWIELEGRIIEVMLLEYWTVLGIVETAVSSEENFYGTPFFRVNYFRITKLGAALLGMSEPEETDVSAKSTPPSGIIVKPNFDIIIGEGSAQTKHQLFFDPFATLKADEDVTIYNLDFPAIVKALHAGLSIQAIIDYMTENSEHEVPANVLSTLREWESKSGKIRIRQATIVETDDEQLLQELLSSKPIRKFVTGELKNAFEIDASSASGVKREIEKKQYFCE